MSDVQAILGGVTLLIVAVAMILALTILVLIEARWVLRLWVELNRRWKASINQLRDDDANHVDGAGRRRGE
jgi:hypothetical protein